MTEDLLRLAARIADALERMAPPPPPEPDFAAARLFRLDPTTGRFAPAPDYRLTIDLLMGIDRQKERFCENLRRFAQGLPSNNVLLWGVRGTGKSSLAKAALMAMGPAHPGLRMVEIDRDLVRWRTEPFT